MPLYEPIKTKTWQEKVRGLLGGISLDPKANPLPNEGVFPYVRRRLKEAAADTYEPIKKEVVAPLNEILFGREAKKPNVSFGPPTVDAKVGAKIVPDNVVSRPEGIGTYNPNTGVASVPRTQGVPSEEIARRISTENPYGANVNSRDILTNQVRVGAPTDTDAARNLEARALQDQATQAEVARLNRATEAMKSLREERSPPFRFGVDVIGRTGGIESKLNEASGRVVNRNTPADAVASRMQEAIQSAKTRGLGKKAGLLAAEQIAKAYEADKAVQQAEIAASAKQPTGVDPIELNRFLLDQNKFQQQQAVDKYRLGIEKGTLEDKIAGTDLEKQKYADARRKEFITNFSYPEEGAPVEQIASAVLSMSDATGGAVPPEAMTAYFKQAAKKAGVDWKNAPPKDTNAFRLLTEEAMKLATAANR